MRIRVLIVMNFVFATMAMPAEESGTLPTTLDLKSARRLVEAHNPGLKVTGEKVVEQNGRLRQIRSARYPHLDVVGDYNTYDEGRVQQFGGGPEAEDENWNVGVEASATIYAGGRSAKLIRSAEQEKLALREDRHAMLQNALLEMYRAYYDAGLSLERIAAQEEAIAVLEEQHREAVARFDAKVGTKFEVTQAAVALANARPPLVRARNAYRRDVDRLRQVIGLPYPAGVEADEIKLERPPMPEEQNLSLDQALAKAFETRSEFKRMDYELEASKRAVEAVRRDHRPVVDLYGGYGLKNDQFGGEELEGWVAGVRLKWNFIDGGAHRGRLEERLARHRQIRHQHEALALNVEGEIRRAHYDRNEARSILDMTKAVIEQAEESLKLARNRYDADKGTQLDVLEGQLQLTRARLELSTAKRDYYLAIIAMQYAVGVNL